eukprot:TRINITY_DN8236_c0_g1_i2.p1 TRINITY_DN8236_c0_g1~~TRINITY_DN8236_c0_g1_i2.p1  ORF type:complete len:200 (-),score=30.62 TRINITY_DN8236_c0_g1_i2:21-620(-)
MSTDLQLRSASPDAKRGKYVEDRDAATGTALLLELPAELLFGVLSLLGGRDLTRVSAVCRLLHDLATQDALWQHTCANAFSVPLQKLCKPSWQSWHGHWITMCRSSVHFPAWTQLPKGFICSEGHFAFGLQGNTITKMEPAADGGWTVVKTLDLPSQMSKLSIKPGLLIVSQPDGTADTVLLDDDLDITPFYSVGRAYV